MILGITPDYRMVMSGADIFDLKDTHGLPLSVSFSECDRKRIEIDWCGLIDAAREHGWWDFQIMEAIAEGFTDSGVWAERRPEIECRLKAYIMKFPHPSMIQETQ